MDAIEIADFLADHRTGVLSLARDDEAYAIPVSYVYEPEEQAVYFRLGYGTDSTKRGFVDAVDRATFVVYDRTDDGWKSVVVRGPVEELSTDTLDSTVLEATADLDIPYFRVFDRRSGSLEFRIARLEATDLTGVVEG